MARVLYDGLVEYEDGTKATTSQMAKDVVEFLNWAAEPEMDVRKQMGIKTVVITSALLALSIWVKRYSNLLPISAIFANEDFSGNGGPPSRRGR
jgi:ubiquinol-cytochrome c reductase cytochrome c1 subunit